MRERVLVLGLLIGGIIGYLVMAEAARAAAPRAYDLTAPLGACDGIPGWTVVENWPAGSVTFRLSCFIGPDGNAVLRGG